MKNCNKRTATEIATSLNVPIGATPRNDTKVELL